MISIKFQLLSLMVISWGFVKSETEYAEEPQTEIEYQPIEAKLTSESQQEVSTRPLPPEPVHPQFVISGNQTPVNPPQNASSEPVLPQPSPPVQPVSGKRPGIKTGPFTPSAIEPEPPILQPAPTTPLKNVGGFECHKVLDLGILMDSSYSISPTLWEEEKSIAVTLLDKLDMTSLGTHMSVMTFSTEVDLPVAFNGYKDAEDLKRKVAQLSYHTGWSRTDLGLTAVKDRMFVPQAGVRDIGQVPRALVVFTDGKTDGSPEQNFNWTNKVSQAADDLKQAQIKIICVQIGEATSGDVAKIRSISPLVFAQTDIEGMLGTLLDMCAEMCSNEDTRQQPTRLPMTTQLPPPATSPLPTPAPYPVPPPVNQPAPYPMPVIVPAGSCQVPQCTYPSVCISAVVYQTCVPPSSATSVNSTCMTPGLCTTTLTMTTTDTTTLTNTQTQTTTAVATEPVTKTLYTTETSTALLTSHVPVTSTKTLTTTSVTTNTHTLTSTAVVKTTATETSIATVNTTNTAVVTSTSHETKTSTAVETSTATATSTAVVTETATSTSTSTDTVTSTKLATSTQTETATTTLTATSTGVATSTLVNTATKTNTVNTTQIATETLTKTLTTTATDKTTVTHNATNHITATLTSTAIATSTAVTIETSTAKTTETLTAISTAVQTQTLTNTLNHTLTQTKTLTTVSTNVVTTCSANCTVMEPTPSPTNKRIVPSTPTREGQGCAVSYTKLGCFIDDRKKPRPLPELMFTDRDTNSRVSSGNTVDWNNWDKYIVDVVCRCAKAASAKEYSHFSIQYYGECWSGPEAGETYNRAGTSNNCTTTGYKECNLADKTECVGMLNVNFVYGIGVQPTPTPTQPTPTTSPPVSVTPTGQVPTPTTPTITPSVTTPTTPTTKRPKKTPTTLPPPPECNQAMDVGVVIDSSESIEPNQYKRCLQFVSDLATYLKVSTRGTHFGAILYSTTPMLQFNFADSNYYDINRLTSDVKNFPHLSQGTRTDLALSLANTELFTQQGGDRPDKPNVMIVITDGRTNNGSAPYPTVLQPLQEKDVLVLAVGVGKDIDKKELKAIAMNNPDNSFKVSKFKHLRKVLNQVLIKSCRQGSKAAPTTLTPTISPTSSPTNNQKCNVEYQKIGCFNDRKKRNQVLPLPKMLVDQTKTINFDAWNAWLPEFVCQCANQAIENNYHVFGIHDYGECLSGTKAASRYNRYGTSQQCIDLRQQPCDEGSVGECAGEQHSNYVYRIVVSQAEQAELTDDKLDDVQHVHSKGEVFANCPADFTKKGCFNDLQNPRPLPRLLFTDLDQKAPEYSGFPVDWGNFDNYLENVACRCAQVSKAKGFTYFGIENFGECWSGDTAGKTYDRDGSSEFCITKEFGQCDINDRNACCGNETTTFVYNIQDNFEAQQDEVCFTQFENVGCFADKQLTPRPMPYLVFTDMDKLSPKFSGNEAKLGDLDTYLGNVLCRCATQARELGFKYFGVQNHGECYSGSDVEVAYNRDGPSNHCITRNFKECSAISLGNNGSQEDCVGAQGSNYVYRIIGMEQDQGSRREDYSSIRWRKKMANK